MWSFRVPKHSLQVPKRLFQFPKITAAVGRYDRSRDRSIESIGSIGSIIFRSFETFSKDRSRRDDRFRPKIVQIRAILAIFRPFEYFCDFRFGRFGIAFGSIDMASEGRGGPPWCMGKAPWHCQA